MFLWKTFILVFILKLSLEKIYFEINHHLVRHFEYYGACLSSPLPFLCSQVTTPFLKIQLSPPIRKQGFNVSPLWNPYTLILVLVYNFFCLELDLKLLMMRYLLPLKSKIYFKRTKNLQGHLFKIVSTHINPWKY